MKIGIVTLYKGSNYGAFLQAFALQSYLQENGNHVWFIRNHSRKPFLVMCKKVIMSFLFGKFHRISFLITQENEMRCARRVLKEKNVKDSGGMDIIILGSDEIWNIKRKKTSRYPILLGKGIHHNNKISYAPSVNEACIEDFYRRPEFVKALKELKYISVRDKYSQRIIEQVTGKTVQLVLDPTMLMSKDFYCQYLEVIAIDQPFILVYSYGKNMDNKDIITEIVQYAHNNKIILVSVLRYLDWCDYNIGASPFEVLTYFNKAESIITDTFHGTVFSIIFEKNFIIPSVDSRKLEDLLSLFDVEDRVIKESGKVEEMMAASIDYSLLNQILCEKIKESKSFLNDALKK